MSTQLPENVVWCQSSATFKRFIDINDFSKFFANWNCREVS